MNKRIILVGAKPPTGRSTLAGGILTMSKELDKYAESKGYHLDIIDTLQFCFPKPPLLTRIKKGIFRIFSLFCYLNKKNVSGVILFCSNGLSIYERMLMTGICKLYGVKSVLYIVFDFFAVYGRNKLSLFFYKWLFKLPSIISLQGESIVSQYEKLDIPRNKLIVIRNWLPSYLEVAHLEPIKIQNHSSIRFCFIGWLVKAKGVLEVFDAILILSEHYDFKFTFIGGGTLQPSLQEKITMNRLDERVNITGWVDPADIPSYLQYAHVYVLPSKTEGFPISLLEAFSFGLPAICTNVGAISDSLINDYNGFLLENGHAETIASAMEKYLKSPELISQHSTAAIKIIKEHHDRETNCGNLFSQFL